MADATDRLAFGHVPTFQPEDMAKKPARRHTPASIATPFDEARDELFQHIMQCGVIGSDPEHQGEWFDETIRYLAERYHELSPEQLKQIRTLGERFVQPPKQSRTNEAITAA
ncbi:MAG TPA: hypothetical protein VFV33_16540 [Gemmatimonadaceae bacterium]|nr:hypothetical protein [Gemmatimonadaceae bacterium]